MKRQHAMPFGAQVDGASTQFRLWAPGAGRVELELTTATGERLIPLTPDAAGWHTLRLDGIGAGTRYRYLIDGALRVPDPASRFNPDDVQGASEVIDPAAFDWRDGDWRGRPWQQAVIYELHVGAFSPGGDFDGVLQRLDYLVSLGVTAIELMPVADFPGRRNWGYDGVLPFAPDAAYGRPEDLKTLIQEAHARGLMVLLDVVYNHFGPDGNYLHAYAPAFFNPRHTTPWGAAINFDAPGSEVVRDFFIHNALYWLEEFHFDGLRVDAVHAICDDSQPDIIDTLCAAVHAGPGRTRLIHMVLENESNQAHRLERDPDGHPRRATAQWNDDIHHTLHVLLSGEQDGYYADFASAPVAQLGRCLSEGFAFQGDPSPFRQGASRGEPSRHLPPAAFVNSLQTHDQIGNRAFGERLCHLAAPVALEAATALLLLAPQPPMLFMGEEFAAAQPFLFFCDFGPELARAVTDGRRREFAHFTRFSSPAALERIPDPNAPATLAASVLDWSALDQPPHDHWLALYRHLLAIRHAEIIPRLAGMSGDSGKLTLTGDRALTVQWQLGDGSQLALAANLGDAPVKLPMQPGRVLYLSRNLSTSAHGAGQLPPWSVAWTLSARGID
ncbi:malto-oligosyltrehalose trehalohydrolase [Immundisolibacter sp.]|uniref:malto-oligosyltrehalose trehalohydrolase n=1 Tax=Immundisolibacter sp. TaxID=1934948 RepID=UPI00356857F8